MLAYAQLLRLPNVFTAFADILMAGCAIHAGLSSSIFWLLLSSGSLYLAGMVGNDLFDRVDDARLQAFRPIPSGRVSVRSARLLGIGLIITGLLAAGFARNPESPWWSLNNSLSVAIALTIAILLYDSVLKRTPIGPIGMGLCRFLNVLLGLSAGSVPVDLSIHLAAIVGIYIIGVTVFARTEDTTSQRWLLIGAAVVMLIAIILAMIIPTYSPTTVWFGYPIGLVGLGFYAGVPVVNAIRSRQPKAVQRAVKQCIFGLVILDAVMATAFVGWPGLLIILLLLPATWLGRWVYST
jgi:4-hydroxybenzoate polyprenyltransferase